MMKMMMIVSVSIIIGVGERKERVWIWVGGEWKGLGKSWRRRNYQNILYEKTVFNKNQD